MNVAVILAGGVGARVGADVPKQFVEVRGKPVLAYTIDVFQRNANIDAIEVVSHPAWVDEVKQIKELYGFSKVQWITVGGTTFQESTMNGIFNLRPYLKNDDIVVIAFGASPMTAASDIDDSIRVCKEHGNAIAAADIDLCTCIKDDEESTTQSVIRETLKGFASPWTFRFGEVCESYEKANSEGWLETLEPHTTSLYFALGKRLWFSKFTGTKAKITTREDLDAFEASLLLKESRSTTEVDK